jgi:hypothetical protein
VKYVSRSEWGARKPRSSSQLSSTKGVKVHYTGSPEDVRMVDDHTRCVARVRAIQAGHMDGNGWSDVGYSFLVCIHGDVFEGRGLHKLPAANGKDLNSGHYAVCGLVGNAGLTDPSDAMKHGIRDAIEYLRAEGGAGNEIKGHRDGYSTDCPGPRLYAWVKDGAPRPKATATEEDDVAAKDVWDHPIDTGDGKKPWKAGTVLGHLELEQDRIKSKLDALSADNKSLRDEVAAGRADIAEIKALLTTKGT